MLKALVGYSGLRKAVLQCRMEMHGSIIVKHKSRMPR